MKKIFKRAAAFALGAVMVATSSEVAFTKNAEALTQENNVYIIKTCDDLVDFIDLACQETAKGSGKQLKAKMACDITFPAGYKKKVSDDYHHEYLEDIVFDGCGHTISNYNIVDGDHLVSSCATVIWDSSVFGRVDYSEIKNLTIDAGEVRGGMCALAKYVEDCTISNVTVKGKVIPRCDSDSFIGDRSEEGCLVIGAKGSRFVNCKNYADFEQDYSVDFLGNIRYQSENARIAGICYTAEDTSFENCVNYGKITGVRELAGICAVADEKSSFTNCVNYGDITAFFGKAGGICQNCSEGVSFVGCKNYGDIKGLDICSDYSANDQDKWEYYSYDIGGIVGLAQAFGSQNVEIKNCVNEGNIFCRGKGNVGGIAGRLEQFGKIGIVENCINTGSVTAEVGHLNNGLNAGGIFGICSASELKVVECTNVGNVTAGDCAGGFAGSVECWGGADTGFVIDKFNNSGTIKVTKSGATNKGGIYGALEKNDYEFLVTNSNPTHTHTFVVTSKVNPTTAKAGKEVSKCSVCKYEKTKVLPKLTKDPSSGDSSAVTILRGRVKSAKNIKKNRVKVKFAPLANATKYQVQISTTKKFKKKYKGKKYILKSKKVTKTTYTFKKLKVGKTYYVRVRGLNGTVKGRWSKAKKVKVTGGR